MKECEKLITEETFLSRWEGIQSTDGKFGLMQEQKNFNLT